MTPAERFVLTLPLAICLSTAGVNAAEAGLGAAWRWFAAGPTAVMRAAPVLGYGLPMAGGAAASSIGEGVAARVLTSEGTLRTSVTVANQLAGPRSFIPIQSILGTIASGTRVSDPQGVANQFMYRAEAAYNGSVRMLEVLVNENTNTIVHVLFK